METLARSLRRGAPVRIWFLGGATAVDLGWRGATIDVDLHASDDRILATIEKIKESLRINVELVQPEDFVPPLRGSEERHLFIESAGSITFLHHDPYAQLLSKIVRGFHRDLEDGARFLEEGLVDPELFRELVRGIPRTEYLRYPHLSRASVERAVDDFLESRRRS
jgi:hypothetical protein